MKSLLSPAAPFGLYSFALKPFAAMPQLFPFQGNPSGHSMKFFFTTPSLSLSGVNTASAGIVRALRLLGADARLLITDPAGRDPSPLPLSGDIPVARLGATRFTGKAARRRMLRGFLEDEAPCVYVPGYDFALSDVSRRLSDKVAVLGVLHSDEAVHYRHVERLGRFWNRIVAVSGFLAREAARRFPECAGRVVFIPSGVTAPLAPPPRPDRDGPLRIAYAGRLSSYQKRVLDLAPAALLLDLWGHPFSLVIAGEGKSRRALARRMSGLSRQGLVRFTGTLSNEAVCELFRQSHAFVLTSDFEGTPVALLEAMAAGCVPVVTDIRSGIPELVEDGVTGLLTPVGEPVALAGRLALLSKNRDLWESLSRNAHAKIARGPYLIENVAKRYIEEAENSFREVRSGRFRRPKA